jgi:tetratricopeptide (TPR) repeat protein
MAQIAATEIASASTALIHAGCWEAAQQLLDGTRPDDERETLTHALAVTEVAVEQDFARGTTHAPTKLAVAAEALDKAPDPIAAWDLDLLRLRSEYFAALLTADGSLQFGPEERDSAKAEGLAHRASRLRENAPDDRRAGSATFYAGLIADNLRGLAAKAFTNYEAALELAERSGDDLLAAYALRHLGDHAHTAGALGLARTQWERSTELRQKAGSVMGVLAQQGLLAVLARDEGDRAAAFTLATEVHRWARSLQIGWLEAQTAALLPDR